MKREGRGESGKPKRSRKAASGAKRDAQAKPGSKVVAEKAAKSGASARGASKRRSAQTTGAKPVAAKLAEANAAKPVARKTKGKKGDKTQLASAKKVAAKRRAARIEAPVRESSLQVDSLQMKTNLADVAKPSIVKRSIVPAARTPEETKDLPSYAAIKGAASGLTVPLESVRSIPPRKKRERPEEQAPIAQAVSLGAIGMESEFTVLFDGKSVKPEDVFGSPTSIVRAPMIHRTGRSYHLPSGGAVYFDTGVIEIATGMIEIEKGCAARAGRSLWENIRFLREELDDWEKRHGHDVELQGFSTHYNISFSPTKKERRGAHRSVGKLALLLTYILPIPVMLLAANRRSTGVGVRPRGNRVEVTADFTPDAALMIATGTVCVGIIKSVMTWPSYELSELDQYSRDLPMIRGVHPVPHSSRKGWSAKYTCYPENPFIQDIDEPMWATTGGERLSLREIAGRITKFFWPSIQRFSDPFTLRLIGSVMRGRAPSLLELEDRPKEYDSVGRLCQWDDLFPERVLPRSRYERVLGHAISGERLKLAREVYIPVGMQGWAHVVFRRERDKSRHVLSLDYLLDHLDEWDSGATRR
jgi:hypothetical protein